METKRIQLVSGRNVLPGILESTGEIAEKCGLGKKQRLQLQLLVEELMGMMPELLEECDGIFWIENDGSEFRLHIRSALPIADRESREKLLALSSSGRNSAAVGFMGKVRAAAEDFLSQLLSPDVQVPMTIGAMNSINGDVSGTSCWTMTQYMEQAKTLGKGEAWDEMEKSIVANLADEVEVGIRGNQVEILVRKRFKQVS